MLRNKQTVNRVHIAPVLAALVVSAASDNAETATQATARLFLRGNASIIEGRIAYLDPPQAKQARAFLAEVTALEEIPAPDDSASAAQTGAAGVHGLGAVTGIVAEEVGQ